MAKIKPIGDRVLIAYEDPKADEMRGGIFIPQTASEKPQTARVLDVGHGARDKKGARVPFEVKPGDLVVLARYSGAAVDHEGEKMTVLNENDIIGVVEGQ